MLSCSPYPAASLSKSLALQTPFLAVSDLVRMGSDVSIHPDGGVIAHRKTDSTINFKRVSGVYVLSVRVAPPGAARRDGATKAACSCPGDGGAWHCLGIASASRGPSSALRLLRPLGLSHYQIRALGGCIW